MPFSLSLSSSTLTQRLNNSVLLNHQHYQQPFTPQLLQANYKQTITTHSLTTATMSSPYTVQIHQSTKEPSISSSYSYSSGSYSSSTSTTPRSLSPGEYREYGAGKLPATESPGSSFYFRPTLTVDAGKHTTQVAKSGRNLVINHNKVSYEKDSPVPTYAGAYTRT
jgi:hypothetical protein